MVTGTLWSGEIDRGDALEVLPGPRRARAREVQVHDQQVERARAGQRVAVNLSGVARRRGRARRRAGRAPATRLRETYLIDAELGFEDRERAGASVREPAGGERVQVHHGTRETPARLAWLGGAFWQLRLEQPLVPVAGDRLVVRQIAPPDTLGGGPGARPPSAQARPEPRADGAAGPAGPGRGGRGPRLSRRGSGAGRPRGRGRRPRAEPEPAALSAAAVELEQRLRAAGLEPPLDSELDGRCLAELRAAGRAVRVSQSLHYHPEALAELTERVVAAAGRRGGSITLAQLRDELGTSRKFAQALLEHLDAERVTIRRGDEHVLRRARRPS